MNSKTIATANQSNVAPPPINVGAVIKFNVSITIEPKINITPTIIGSFELAASPTNIKKTSKFKNIMEAP